MFKRLPKRNCPISEEECRVVLLASEFIIPVLFLSEGSPGIVEKINNSFSRGYLWGFFEKSIGKAGIKIKNQERLMAFMEAGHLVVMNVMQASAGVKRPIEDVKPYIKISQEMYLKKNPNLMEVERFQKAREMGSQEFEKIVIGSLTIAKSFGEYLLR